MSQELYLAILDPLAPRAPTAMTAVLVEGVPQTAVTFEIDGVEVGDAATDSDGYLAPTSINVPEGLLAGTHTLTAVQAGATTTGTATFTLQNDPAAVATTVGADASPVDVPGAVLANGLRRWVLQDLMPGGLGSWVMPANPKDMSSPYLERNFNTQTTTAGRHHVSEGARVAVAWKFNGAAFSEADAEQLLAFGDLNRRFYVIDHRGRAFKVVFTDVELVPRLRTNLAGELVDGHDYAVTALVLDQEWVTPV